MHIFRIAVVAIVVGTAMLVFGSETDAQDSFNGYPCTEDCSGHQAGYDWAEQQGITDPDDCGGNSQSFIEGCQSYAEENGASSDGESSDESTDDGSSGGEDSE